MYKNYSFIGLPQYRNKYISPNITKIYSGHINQPLNKQFLNKRITKILTNSTALNVKQGNKLDTFFI